MKKNNFNQNIKEMKQHITIIEEHLNNYFESNVKFNQKSLSSTFIRNINYLDSMSDKIKENMEVIEHIKNTKGDKKVAKEKIVSNIFLLKHFDNLTNNFSFTDNDFEIYNLALHKNNLDSFLSKVPTKYKNNIKEDFESISENKGKIFEGFSNVMKPVTKVFKKIVNSFKSVIKTLEKVGKFISKYLMQFVKLFMKILSFLSNLIFKVIPKLVKKTYLFLKSFGIKLYKVGLISLLIYLLAVVVLMKYWQIVLETQNPSTPLYLVPAGALAIFLFWAKTKTLQKIQAKILKGIINFLTGTLTNLFCFIFGFPKDDKFFRYKLRPNSTRSLKRKIQLLLVMINKNMASFTIRLLLLILGIKYFLKYTSNQVEEGGIIDIRDILLFPVVLIKFGTQFLINPDLKLIPKNS